MKQITFLEELPDDFGTKGKGFHPYKDHAKTAGRIALKYASVTGTVLGILSIAITLGVIG